MFTCRKNRFRLFIAPMVAVFALMFFAGCAGPEVKPETSNVELKATKVNLQANKNLSYQEASKEPFSGTYNLSITSNTDKRATTKLTVPDNRWLVLKTMSAGVKSVGSNFPSEVSIRTSDGASIFLPTYTPSPYGTFFSGTQYINVYVSPGATIEIALEVGSAGLSSPGLFGTISITGYYIAKP
jgi:hypothetical protein